MRGLKTKLDSLLVAVTATSYDVIVLVETWLDDSIANPQLFGADYEVFRRDRNHLNSSKASGGGVLIAIHKRHSASPALPELSPELEQVWAVISNRNSKLYLGSLYLPPDRRNDAALVNSHIAAVETFRSKLKDSDALLILGDYNMPSINWSANFVDSDFQVARAFDSAQALSSSATQIVDNFEMFGLAQINIIHNHQGKLLDLIFADIESAATSNVEHAIHPLIPEDRFHPALDVHIRIPLDQQAKTDTCFDATALDFAKVDYDVLLYHLQNFDWTPVTSCNNVDEAVERYESSMKDILQQIVPPSTPKDSPPWSTPHLLKLKTRRNAAKRAYRSDKSGIVRRHFFAASDRYRKENDRLYKKYVINSERSLRQHPKRFWSFVNSKRKDNGLPASMFLGDRRAATTPDICNLFADRFASVFSNDNISNDQLLAATNDVPKDISCTSSFPIRDTDIIKASKKLKSSLSAGPDGIPTCIISKCIHPLLMPLRHIFKISLDSGSFPTRWKRSYMFPVHKKGDRCNMANYRGITSLSSSSKLLELLVSSHLMSKFKCYISTSQHGFFPGRSVSTNLLEFSSFITHHMESRSQVDAVYTDLRAAFDCLNHAIIVAKLDKLGVHGALLRWIKSYLTGRSLKVKLGSAVSRPLLITSGVPQGSNLGPLLFSLFFNDVSLGLPIRCRLFYADDLKIYTAVRNHADTQSLQGMLDFFSTWCQRNRMTLSLDKCSVITFAHKKYPISANYTLCGTPVQRVQRICDLGVILDTKLTFNDHMTSIISRANRQLGFISRICRSFTDPYCFRSLYYSLVRSILEFSSIVWSPSYSCWVNRIEAVQRRFIRIALKHLPWQNPLNLPPYEDRCKLIDVTPLYRRRRQAGILFTAKVLLNEVDCPSILKLMSFNVPARRLRSSVFFHIPFHRTNYGRNDPLCKMCRDFNNVSFLFDFSMSFMSFKESVVRLV